MKRSKNIVALLKKPGTTLAWPRNMVRTPSLATALGSIVNNFRRNEAFWPAISPNAVAESPGHKAVTDTPRGASSRFSASPNKRT